MNTWHEQVAQEQQGEIWGAVVGVVGIATSLYSANKQKQDTAHAQDVNIASQNDAERDNWTRYLSQRGLAPSANTPVGEIPGRPAGSNVNTRLPLWANIVRPQIPTATRNDIPFLVRKPGM